MDKIFFFFLLLGLSLQGFNAAPAQDVNWFQDGKDTISKLQNLRNRVGRAKNVILFVGDGMGISTQTAARIYKGQLKGQTGEEETLVFENFPNTAFSKVYTADHQVPGSSATATAFLSGVKANSKTLGLNHHQLKNECTNVMNNSVTNILRWSQLAGKATGIVTTTRVTHATPAAGYASSPHRDWEAYIQNEEINFEKGCRDIAYQLVHGQTGKDLNVILGGGWASFQPPNMTSFDGGKRKDGKDLLQEWKDIKYNTGKTFKMASNRKELLELDSTQVEYLLGLFSSSHMSFEINRNKTVEPSIAEMTEIAIKALKKDSDGFMLLVEGGRIDHAHHGGAAKVALVDTLAFEAAVQKALDLTNIEDTLIIVTADHSHVFTIGGMAPTRGNDILGIVNEYTEYYYEPLDGKKMTTLMYANGPKGLRDGQNRTDPGTMDTTADDYRFDSLVPTLSETHSGEDVGIYAQGPMAHMFRGVLEQNVIAHVMAFASCVGEYSDCKWAEQMGRPVPSAAEGMHYSIHVGVLALALWWICKYQSVLLDQLIL